MSATQAAIKTPIKPSSPPTTEKASTSRPFVEAISAAKEAHEMIYKLKITNSIFSSFLELSAESPHAKGGEPLCIEQDRATCTLNLAPGVAHVDHCGRIPQAVQVGSLS